MTGSTDDQAHERPALRIVRGNATPEEIAALVSVLAARSGPMKPERSPSAWTDRARLMRRPLAHGPGAWRASAHP